MTQACHQICPHYGDSSRADQRGAMPSPDGVRNHEIHHIYMALYQGSRMLTHTCLELLMRTRT